MRELLSWKRSFLLLVFTIIVNTQSAELCRAALNCPPNYANDTVIVSPDVVMLSEVFEHCSPDSIKEGIIDTLTDTISLFIIIDHSGSMAFKDSLSERYKVATNIIDSIYAVSPASEVGIAVFSNKLMHNKTTDPFFETLDSSEVYSWNDAFVPLTRLDSDVSGVPAINKLKWAIELDNGAKDPGGNFLLNNADYGTSGRKKYSGGTDISLAFEAAKEAFANATYEKEKQFILFLSDGKHDFIDAERVAKGDNYLAGTGVPTTYTAYFINSGQPIPDQIKTMTENIQNNGYSSNNFSSNVWSTKSDEKEFLDLLFNNIIGDGLKNYYSTPKLMVINGDSTRTFDSVYAYFDEPFSPLNKNGTLTLDVSYTYRWNDPINLEETKEFTIEIQHGDNPDLESVDCWEQGTFSFYSNGMEISKASPTQTSLELRFYPPTDSNAPVLGNPIDVVLENIGRTDILDLQLRLDGTGTYYYSNFIREYGAPIVDGKLQNMDTDSITAVFRNPQIPLDTVRSGILVMPLMDMSISGVCYYDSDANGHPDLISVTQKGGEVLTADDCSLLKPYTSIVSPREVGPPVNIYPQSSGFSVSIPQNGNTVLGKTDLFMTIGENIDEYLYVKYQGNTPLSSGNIFPFSEETIDDSMAPVINRAIYYDLQSASDADTLKVLFSEKVSDITSINPFNIRGVGADTTFYSPDLNFVGIEGDTVVFSVAPGVKPEIISGDSIWINVAGGVSDINGNMQSNISNVKREIYYYKVVSLVSASYYDNSDTSDGLIDCISFKTNATIDSLTVLSLIDSMTFNTIRGFTIDSVGFLDDGFNIFVTQPKSTEPMTFVDSLDVISFKTLFTYKEIAVFQGAVKVADSLPPVLLKAAFSAGYYTDKSQNVLDTLVVSFSEPVVTPPFSSDEPFNFICKTGDSLYTMTIEILNSLPDGKTHIFSVISKSKSNPQGGDDVNIDVLGMVSDAIGNTQINPKNRLVPLEVQKSDLLITISITNNPGKITDSFVLNGTVVTGIGIKTEILGNGWPLGVIMTGQLRIYDAVGNEVIELPGVPISDHSGFWFLWDGTNSKGRYTYSGTYIGIVEIHNVSEDFINREKFSIGIKTEIQ